MIFLNANENPNHYVDLATVDFSSFSFNRYPDAAYPELIDKLAALRALVLSRL